MPDVSAHLLLAWSAYVVGTASPGPSNLAIMATAMNAGRRSALFLAAGVVTGSWFWGLAAFFGLSALLATYSQALVVLKLLGGLYLLWLALKSARSAWSSRPPAAGAGVRENPRRTFLRGAAMHLTNPKAIFVWMSIVSMALPVGARVRDAWQVVAGCAWLGLCIFMGYALLFSAPLARRVYARLRRRFEGALALVFGYAGLRMLLSRTPRRLSGYPAAMRNAVFGLAGLAALLYLGLCAALYVWQRSLLYLPHPPSGQAQLALPVQGATLRVVHRPAPGLRALIYFGGNAEDVSLSLPGLAAAFDAHALYLPHYRGYGGSTGQPSEAALFADALALYDQVAAAHPEVTVVGRSLGSGVATWLASQRPVQRLVLVTPYRSIAELAALHYPWAPVRWLIRDRYESFRYAPRVSAPTLVLAAERDEVVPRASTEALLPAFRPGLVQARTLPGTDHNSVQLHPDYYTLLAGKSKAAAL